MDMHGLVWLMAVEIKLVGPDSQNGWHACIDYLKEVKDQVYSPFSWMSFSVYFLELFDGDVGVDGGG